MRTQPASFDDNGAAIGGARNKPPGLARRIGARLLNEARGALPPTIFFFVGFNFVVFTTNLLLADYAVAVSSFMLATVAALVVGKAVLVANAMPYLRRYDRAPLIQPILYKTAFYWVVVFFARLIQRFVHFSDRDNFVGLPFDSGGEPGSPKAQAVCPGHKIMRACRDRHP